MGEHALGLDRGGVASARTSGGRRRCTSPSALGLTAVLVALAAPFERLPVPWLERPGVPRRGGLTWSLLACLGAFLSACGFLVVAATGMNGFPFSHVSIYCGHTAHTRCRASAWPSIGILCVRAAARQRAGAPGAEAEGGATDVADLAGNPPN